jgi:hypothetical protein
MGEVTLRYAVLRHSEIAEPHFDFLVETYPGSELATWRSAVWPIEQATVLKRLKDHRRIYLDYEGELSERRGRVERVAAGTCNVDIGESSVWTIQLLNHQARLILRRISNDVWEADMLKVS